MSFFVPTWQFGSRPSLTGVTLSVVLMTATSAANDFELNPATDEVESGTFSISDRELRLERMRVRRDPSLVMFLVAELHKTHDSPEWVKAVLKSADALDADDFLTFRESMKIGLLHQARLLQRYDGHDEDTRLLHEDGISIALRVWGRLADEVDAPLMLPFMSAIDSIECKKNAVQSVEDIFRTQPPTRPELLGTLSDRIYEVAERCVGRMGRSRARVNGLAMYAVRAGLLVGHSKVPELLSAFHGHSSFDEWFLSFFIEILGTWRRTVGIEHVAVARLREVAHGFGVPV